MATRPRRRAGPLRAGDTPADGAPVDDTSIDGDRGSPVAVPTTDVSGGEALDDAAAVQEAREALTDAGGDGEAVVTTPEGEQVSEEEARRRLDQQYSRFSPRRITGAFPLFPFIVLFGLNAVDEFDRVAFNTLLPEVEETFNLGLAGVLTLSAVIAPINFLIDLPIGYWADRKNRMRMTGIGASLWATFSVLTGVAGAVISLPLMYVARAGSAIGKSLNNVHNSLIPDFYPQQLRARVFYAHRFANNVGQIIAPLLAGLIATFIFWQAAFYLLAIPSVIFVVLAFVVKEPRRGVHERRAAGADDATANTEEEPAGFGETFRVLFALPSARRIYYSLPFLTVSLFGIGNILSLFYDDVYNIGPLGRGFINVGGESTQIGGLIVGAIVVQKIMNRDPGLVIRALAAAAIVQAIGIAGIALSPNVTVAIGFQMLNGFAGSLLTPGIYAVVSLVVPPRMRTLGFATASLWFLLGVPFLPLVGGIGDAFGLRVGLLVFIPVYLVGSFLIASSGNFTVRDMKRMQLSARTQSEARLARLEGRGKLLICREVDVSYGGTQVLFGVDLEVADGEILALLGTNGAGKSTILKAISGLVNPEGGAIIFDGVDITSMDAVGTAKRGIAQMPGGRGVFPSLTVAENLRAAGWLYRRDSQYVKEATDRVLEYFPVLRDRWNIPAGSLSGGQQQMLSLGMAFIARPKLLMIDELTLGLAPTVVEQLLDIVRAIHANGTTLILVEQSVNVALRIAKRAVFMEKGEVRFSGPTAELLERDDILRSVFLKGAAAVEGDDADEPAEEGASVEAQEAREREAAAKLENPVVLETVDLTKRYGGLTAVNAVSIELHEHEILGLIGPNGAGKTTIMDLISGFQALDGGRVIMHGRDVTEWGANRRAAFGLGRSFQDARLWSTLTVKENLLVALEREIEAPDALLGAFGLPAVRDSERRIEERAEELIELMGLAAFRDKFVGELSTGSRRMVEIGAILGHHPSILLLDEPSSGIAQRETEALGPVLRRVQAEMGCAILIIEHDMPLISSLADHIVALDQGAVVTVDRPDAVLNHPQVVESYLGGAHDYGELTL